MLCLYLHKLFQVLFVKFAPQACVEVFRIIQVHWRAGGNTLPHSTTLYHTSHQCCQHSTTRVANTLQPSSTRVITRGHSTVLLLYKLKLLLFTHMEIIIYGACIAIATGLSWHHAGTLNDPSLDSRDHYHTVQVPRRPEAVSPERGDVLTDLQSSI